MNRHIFSAVKANSKSHTFERVAPKVGDLIRNSVTGDYINIVLEVTPETYKGMPDLLIRSVRYGNTNGGNFKLLNGTRSRNFFWNGSTKGCWEVVEEFVKFDNESIRHGIVNRLRGVFTGYRPNTDEPEFEPCQY